MSSNSAERPDIAGLTIEEALEILDTNGESDRDTQAALDYVTTDDESVVSPEAAESALGETATVVSTPETRTELAAIALEDARESAAQVEDVDVVSTRLESYEARLDSLRSGLEELGADLQTLVRRDVQEADLVAIGHGIRQVRAEADELQATADNLQQDLEEFEEWLEDPATRQSELEADIDVIVDSFAEREKALEAIAANGDGAMDDGRTSENPGEAWADATVGHRVSGLLLADVGAELADLRTMAERQDEGSAGDDVADGLAAIDAQIAELRERRNGIGERLDELARPAWRDRFDDRFAAVEEMLADANPPVAWGTLQVAIDEAQH